MTAAQFVTLLLARKWFLIAVLAGFIVLGIVVNVLWPDTYTAEVSVVIDSKGTDLISGNPDSPALLPTNLATQLQIVASHNVALKVVDKLNLASNTYFKDLYMDSTKGKGSIRDWIADRLINKNLVAIPSKKNLQQAKEGSVIDIDLSSPDPILSTELANAFADSYILTHLELKIEPSKRQAAWFDEQLKDMRAAVDAAQKRLSDYQRTNNVTGTDAKIDVENARLDDISNRVIAAQTAMYDAQTRLKQMNEALQKGELLEIPDIAGNTLLQTMKGNLVVAQARLAQISAGFGNNHPDYISAEAQVKELQRKFLAEVDVAKGSVSQAAAISSRQEMELRRALDQQRDRLLALKRQKDDLESFRREVDNAQAAYDAGVQRANQVRLESRLDQSDIAVLNAAFPPTFRSQPKVMINLAVAILLGLFVGPALVLTKETLSPRIRSSVDMTALAGIPLLAELPRGPRGRHPKALSKMFREPSVSRQVVQQV